MVVRWNPDSYFLYGKYLKKNSFIPSPHWIKLENFVMQLKRQSVEAWQNEKHYSKGNNTSENPFPRQEISNQSTMWSTKVRSGHNICCLCRSLLELSSCRVTYKNCYKSSVFQSSVRWVDGFEKFQRFWVKELLLYKRIKSLHFILAQSGNSIIATACPLKSSWKEHNWNTVTLLEERSDKSRSTLSILERVDRLLMSQMGLLIIYW